MIGLYIFLGFVLIVILWLIAIYNNFIHNKNMVKEGWSGIEVQLKRRANLIPNLVEMVKGYMKHEKELLTRLTELRSESMKTENVAEKGKLESAIGRSLASIFAVAEAYPTLTANENFLQLQKEVADIEDHLQMSRRYYNGTVRNWNYLIEAFPSVIVANFFSFKQTDFFEIEDEAERKVPEVKF